MNMRDLWLKTGCFLTGYNYIIIKNSSEASAKSVKKYLSALSDRVHHMGIYRVCFFPAVYSCRSHGVLRCFLCDGYHRDTD